MKKYEKVVLDIQAFQTQDLIRTSEEAHYVDDPYYGENNWWKTN